MKKYYVMISWDGEHWEIGYLKPLSEEEAAVRLANLSQWCPGEMYVKVVPIA